MTRTREVIAAGVASISATPANQPPAHPLAATWNAPVSCTCRPLAKTCLLLSAFFSSLLLNSPPPLLPPSCCHSSKCSATPATTPWQPSRM